MENQDSPPLGSTLAPALLFEPGHGDADDEAREETTDDDGTSRFVYSIPKRRLLSVAGFDYLNSDAATWKTPQGWVLVLDPSTRDASLRDPFTSRTVRLPSDNQNQESGLLPSSNEHTRCLLSKHRPTDDDPGCIVLLVHLEEPVLWYCSPGGSRWSRHGYPSELIDSDHSTIMGVMGRLTAARGKFFTLAYGNGYEKIMALDFSPGPIFSSTHLVRFSSTHLVRAPLLSTFLLESLVESCGDLFIFERIILEPLCAAAVEGNIAEINVYKLVLSSNNAWVKVKVATLGDNRVFFCGNGGDSYEFGASMAADKVGLKENCIYFTHGADKGLYVHDLERGTTTLHNPGTDIPDTVEHVLLMPAIL